MRPPGLANEATYRCRNASISCVKAKAPLRGRPEGSFCTDAAGAEAAAASRAAAAEPACSAASGGEGCQAAAATVSSNPPGQAQCDQAP